MNLCLQIVKYLSVACAPFLPFTSAKIRKMLNLDFINSEDWKLGTDDEKAFAIPAGHQIAKPELLFEKIEDEVIEKQLAKLAATKAA